MRGGLRSNSLSLIFCVLILVGIDVYLLPEDFAYIEFRPNPYLVLSIIFASLYGLTMSFAASLITGGTYILSVHFNLNYEEVETLIDFKYLSTPISILTLSVIFGELSNRRHRRVKILEKELSDLSRIEELQKTRSGEQEKEITELKKRLVSRLDTTRSLFETARSFHSLNEEELLSNLTNALKRLYKTESIEIQSMTDMNPTELGVLAKKAIRLRQQVTLADLMQEKEASGSVTLVLPIILDEEVEYLIEVSDIPFLQYIPSNFRISEIYGQWISSSLSYGRSFRHSERQNTWNEDLKIYRYHYFEDRIAEEFARARSFMIPLSILKVSLQGVSELRPAKLLIIRKLLAGIASKKIRKVDFITEGTGPEEFLVVMPVADRDQAQKIWGPIEEEFSLLNHGQVQVRIIEWKPEMEELKSLLAEVRG